MLSKNVIRPLLAATALVFTGCGADRQFVDDIGGGNPDASTMDALPPSNDARDSSAGDALSADIASTDRRDALSSMDADARADGGRDVTIEQSVPDSAIDINLPDLSTPDAVGDVTVTPDVDGDVTDEPSYDASDASDATEEIDCTSTPPPTISPSGTTTICPGKTVALTSSAAAAYRWSTGATSQAIVVSAAGSYSVATTDNRGCIATSAPTVVTLYPTPTVPTISASGPTRFCSGGNVTLTASSAASYRWSTGATSQSIVATDTGSYTVTTTNSDGCEATSASTDVVRVVPPAGSRTFSYTGLVESFTVPECVTTITADAYGAQGGNGTYYTGGWGGRVQATLTVVANSSLSIRVGGMGNLCPSGLGPGFNGGGPGNCNPASDSASGGGATDVRVSPFNTGNRIIVAGAGGGAGFNCGASSNQPDHGGAGGGLTGQKYPSLCTPAGAGGGGSQVAGGAGGMSGTFSAGAGGLGFGGSGVPIGTTTPTEGGGGGGGYYGGGGGIYGGGGGGSSYVTPSGSSAITHWQGVRAGHGHLIISW
jgi:hypothetical protein